MDRLRQLFRSSFLPTWIATALLIAVQMTFVLFLYEPHEPRPAQVDSPNAVVLGLLVLGTGMPHLVRGLSITKTRVELPGYRNIVICVDPLRSHDTADCNLVQ